MTTKRRPPRGARRIALGMTLIEVMTSFAILGIAILGLVGGLTISSTANGFAATRTQMLEFAQSRMERLTAMDRKDYVCSTATASGAYNNLAPQSCAVMSQTPTPFNPDVAAGTGGWMMDVIDWPPSTNNAGDDLMFGPIVVMGDANAVDGPATLAARTAAFSNWNATSGTGTGCDSPTVQANPAILCREIHIEPFTGSIPDGGTGVNAPMLQVWVRVVRGGSADWHLGSVTLQETFAQ